MRKIRRSRFPNLEFVVCVVTICCFWPWIINAQDATDNVNSDNTTDTNVNANPVNTTNVSKSTYSSALTLVDWLFAAILIVTGALIGFSYIKFTRMAGSIVGFYTLSCLAWIEMLNSDPGYSDYRNLMIPFIIGSLGAMLFLYFNKVGVFFVGILGGCAFGLTTLSVKGVDQILRSGFTTALIIYLDLNQEYSNILKYSINGKVYGLLGGVFVLAAIGLYLQWKMIPSIMPQTSGNSPPAMRDDLEKIVYEMNPSIRKSMRSSKLDFGDMNQLVTVNNEKGDAEVILVIRILFSILKITPIPQIVLVTLKNTA
ncbi:27553_t:CDS:2 [Dentiscutata erythropus]|uniref:27553_t:CDS:1 n=1 Tax=Dentiscutata erythropus TaxID=1348616 RepID=A0A9N8WC68_9GLOM|nr:27553_t:CDS:2 [Dentiscutata erythropus]